MGVSKLSEKVLFLKVNYFFKGIVHLKNLQLFGYPYSLKYLILRRVNDDRIFIHLLPCQIFKNVSLFVASNQSL